MIYIFKTTGQFVALTTQGRQAKKETGVSEATISKIMGGSLNSSNGYTFIRFDNSLTEEQQQQLSQKIKTYFLAKENSLDHFLNS